MNKEPESYEELIRYKTCINLVKYYELSKEELDRIYNYLSTYPDAVIIGNENSLALKNSNIELPPVIINAKCINKNIDGIKLSNDEFNIIPHYVESYSGSDFVGSSSNNNNNNNNNS